MRRTTLRSLTLCAALLAGLALSLAPAVADDKKEDEGFTPVFNGKDLTGWKTVLGEDADPARTWLVKNGMLVCTGTPHGFCYTERAYRNYVVRFDWQFRRPDFLHDDAKFTGRSGMLMHIQRPMEPAVPNTVWPKCVAVLGTNQEHGKLFTLGCCPGKWVFSPKALADVRRPVGDWNDTEVTCKGGSITVKVNGAKVATGTGELTEGPFGFQSDGAEIHFKRIRVKELE
jgi:hypothetical protein